MDYSRDVRRLQSAGRLNRHVENLRQLHSGVRHA